GAGIEVDDIAAVRTGDKGDTLIVGVVARAGIGFAELASAITEEAVASHFGLPVSRVSRQLLPDLHAMSFDVRGMVGQGVAGLGRTEQRPAAPLRAAALRCQSETPTERRDHGARTVVSALQRCVGG